MADNKIQGTAKKFDGTAIDYVSIFNWSDGKCIAQVVPDALGAWRYTYSKALEVGLTYVADGCEPITHGAYSFDYVYDPLLETILHYDFNGNYLDKSANALDGIKTGVASFVAGRKAGTQAIEFTAGCVQTPSVLPINADKVTVSFWISTNQTDAAIIYESGIGNKADSFNGVLNDAAQNAIQSYTLDNQGGNIVIAPVGLDGDYQHIVIEIDRSQTALNEQKIWVNNVLVSTQDTTFKSNTSGNLGNFVFYIGQRAATSVPFVGAMQDFRIYNRILTEAERLALFNE